MEKGNYRLRNLKRSCSTRLLVLFFIGAAFSTQGQTVAQKPARILFLLDASSSMLNEWKKPEDRFHAASRVIGAIADSIHIINPDVAFALRVYGNQYSAQDKNCYDSRLEVPFGYNNVERIQTRLRYLNPMGFSPIAWSLAQTAEYDFVESDRYAYSIVLITDGGESCGGDICATVTNLLAKKISFKPYILSMVDYEPLKQQYECLGKYLTVATEKDIVPAIKTIINDNRVILSIKGSGLQSITAGTTAPILTPVKHQPRVVTVGRIEEDTPRPVVVIPRVARPEDKPAVKEEPVIHHNLIQVDRIRSSTKLFRLNNLYVLPYANPVRIPRLPYIKIQQDEAPKPVTAKTPVVTPPVAPKKTPAVPPRPRTVIPKEDQPVDFLVKQDEAKETTAQVYFTNGQGKFYLTEPRIIFKNSKTQKEIKSLYRNVSGGEPEPIKIGEGTYDIVIPGSKAKASSVVIAASKANKIYIKVSRASLAFYYTTAPNRPVREYLALVSKRFEGGPVVKHKCDEELPYDPTNYHVEINTLPPTIYNVDLNFNEPKLLAIPEPGTIEITNTNDMGKVQFWYRLGDAYVPFLEMTVSGNPAAQKANFLPGSYQVRYYKKPGAPFQQAEVTVFRVNSNSITQVKLEQ